MCSDPSLQDLPQPYILFCVVPGCDFTHSLFPTCSGKYLNSQAVTHQVFSAQQSLTSVFGMGTGVSSASSSPDLNIHVMHETFSLMHHVHSKPNNASSCFPYKCASLSLDQALGLLVPLSFIHYCTSTCGLSTT